MFIFKIKQNKVLDKDEVARKLEEIVSLVTSTMGPFGHNVAIKGEYSALYQALYGIEKPDEAAKPKTQLMTKDGVSVARFLEYIEDPLSNFLGNIVKDACQNTVDKVGDGTTTTAQLVYALYLAFLENEKESSQKGKKAPTHKILKKLDIFVDRVIKELGEISKTCYNSKGAIKKKELLQIATISANGDQEVGKIVSDAVTMVGKEGTVNIRTSRVNETYIEWENGYTIPVILQTQLYLQNQTKVELDNPMYLLLDVMVDKYAQIAPVLDAWKSNSDNCKRPLVIITKGITDEAGKSLIANFKHHGFPIYVLTLAYHGVYSRSAILQDLQMITGTRCVYANNEGTPLDRFGYELDDWSIGEEFGTSSKCILGKESFEIVPSSEVVNEEMIDKRVEYIKSINTKEISAEEMAFNKERIARLKAGIAYIYVHADSAHEMSKIKEVMDDSIRACMAALDGGFVVGGGRALDYVGRLINKKEARKKKSDEFIQTFAEAISSPLAVILGNAGFYFDDKDDFGALMKLTHRASNYSICLEEGGIVDFYKKGIIDPVNVPIYALKNAASVIKELVRTKVFINISR